MKTPRDRIKIGCIALGVSQAQIAEKLGTNRQNVAHIASGRLRSGRVVEGVAKALGCTKEWLLDGTGKPPPWAITMRPSPGKVIQQVKGADSATTATAKLDIVGVVKAGDGDVGPYERSARTCTMPQDWKLVQVAGMSAYPVIYPDQFAVVDLSRAVAPPLDDVSLTDLHDNICLIECDDGRAYLKRLCMAKSAPGGFHLASVDAGRSSPWIENDRILVIAPIVGVLFQEPGAPRKKRWHGKTVVVDTIKP